MTSKVPWAAIIGIGAVAGIGYIAYKYLMNGGNGGDVCVKNSYYCDENLVKWTCLDGLTYTETGTCEQPTSYAFSWGPVTKDGVQVYGATTSTLDQGEAWEKCPGEIIPHLNPISPFYQMRAVLYDQFGNPLPNWTVHLDIEQSTTLLSLCPPDSAGGCGANMTTYCGMDVITDEDGVIEFVLAQIQSPSAATYTCNLKMVANNLPAGKPNLQKIIQVIVSKDGYASGPWTMSGICWNKVGCP